MHLLYNNIQATHIKDKSQSHLKVSQLWWRKCWRNTDVVFRLGLDQPRRGHFSVCVCVWLWCPSPWYSSLLTFNYTSAEDVFFMDSKKLFYPHQEILFFLFYNLLKSANIPTLFSYTFDTTIHAHTSTFIHTYTLPVGSLLHVMANMLESNNEL